jgi:hypothetical protein
MATESGTAAAVVVVATVVTPCDMARLNLKINSLSRPILYNYEFSSNNHQHEN